MVPRGFRPRADCPAGGLLGCFGLAVMNRAALNVREWEHESSQVPGTGTVGSSGRQV